MRAFALLAVGSVLLLACGDDAGGGGDPDTVSRLIGTAGGTVELADGAKVVIPEGALTETREIKITKLELEDVAELPSNVAPAGKPYAFEPFDVVFALAVKVEVPFEGDAAEVRPMKLPNRNADTPQWTTVFPNAKADGKVSGDVTTLGVVLAARPRTTGVVTLPDGAIVEDAGTMDSGAPEGGMDAAMTDATTTDAATADAAVDDDAGSVDLGPRWIWQFGTSAGEGVSGIAVDSTDNTIVVGGTAGSFPGFTNAGSTEAYVRKMNAAGAVLWTRQFGDSAASGASANAVTVDAADNVFIAGSVTATLPGQVNAGGNDVYVRKYDSAGNELWTHQFGSPGTDHMNGVALDADGNVFVTGSVSTAIVGQTHVGNWDCYVRKLDSNGNELWTRQFGTTGQDLALDVAVDATGSAYTVGGAARALDGQASAGSVDAFVRKYDAAGTLQWTRLFGSAGWDQLEDVAIDPNGRVVVAGYTDGALPGQTHAGATDTLVAVYDSSGVQQWAIQFGTSATDSGRAMTVDSESNVLVSGYTLGAFAGFTSAGGRDVFLVQVTSSGTLQAIHQFGALGDDESYAVTTALDDSPVIGGQTQAALQYDPYLGVRDGFVARLALRVE